MALFDDASLVTTPNGYKAGTLYSIKPTSGAGDMTVVRATTATRVNSAGLIELVPYNLITYSEQFDNANWLTLVSSSVTANTTTAPNGTATADTLTFSANSSSSIYQLISIPKGQITLSIYAKVASGTKQFRLRVDAPSGSSSSNFTATTEWQRFDFNVTTTATADIFYIINDSAGTAGSLFIWGAQLVQGTLPKDYVRTETRLNIPRLDYSNGSCPSLLVEPQRTNLFLQSEDLTAANWVGYRVNITSNQTISPSGIQNADLIADTATSGTHWFEPSFSATNGSSYTLSYFVKANTLTQCAIYGWSDNGVFAGQQVIFNLTNGTVLSNSGNGIPKI